MIAQPQTIFDCRQQGRNAFTEHGVTGCVTNPYERYSPPWLAFDEGFSVEQRTAAERASKEALAYHAMTLRDAPLDRAHAERIAKLRGL